MGKVWRFYECATVVPDRFGKVTERLVSVCQECGARIQYVVTLFTDSGDARCVGFDCAETLVRREDSGLPTLAYNEVRRRAAWRSAGAEHESPGVCFVDRAKLIERGKL
jgi:hypothetical protein